MGEAGHWYDRTTGKLVTGVPYADPKRAGELRPPDLRDARKYGFAASVTTILNVVEDPGLVIWQVRHAVETAIRTMRQPGETPEDRVRRIVEEHKAFAEEAADAGSQVHLALSCLLTNQGVPAQVAPEWDGVARQAIPWMQEQGFETKRSEHSFVSELGWAGTVDWQGTRLTPRNAIADFKTQDFAALKEDRKNGIRGPNFYEKHGLQLAGYDVGVNGPEADSDRYSIILSRSVPGLIALHKWEDNAKWNRKWLKLWEFWKELKEWNQ